MLRLLLLGLLLLPGLAAAEEATPADPALNSWLRSLDKDHPASGPVAQYSPGEELQEEQSELLASALRSGDLRVASVAVDELSAYGGTGEGLLLAAAANPEVPEPVRFEALRALREIGSGRALPVFGTLAMTEEGALQREAILGLCALEAPEAEPILRELTRRGDRRTQHWIVMGLRQAGARAAARGARREARQDRREDRQDRREGRREEREERREERNELRAR